MFLTTGISLSQNYKNPLSARYGVCNNSFLLRKELWIEFLRINLTKKKDFFQAGIIVIWVDLTLLAWKVVFSVESRMRHIGNYTRFLERSNLCLLPPNSMSNILTGIVESALQPGRNSGYVLHEFAWKRFEFSAYGLKWCFSVYQVTESNVGPLFTR